MAVLSGPRAFYAITFGQFVSLVGLRESIILMGVGVFFIDGMQEISCSPAML